MVHFRIYMVLLKTNCPISRLNQMDYPTVYLFNPLFITLYCLGEMPMVFLNNREK